MTTAPPTTAPSTIQRLRSASAAAMPRANPAMIIGNDPAASPTPRASSAGSGTTSMTGGPVAVGFAEVSGRVVSNWAMAGDPAERSAAWDRSGR